MVDASIMSMLPGANTCQPVYAIAEKVGSFHFTIQQLPCLVVSEPDKYFRLQISSRAVSKGSARLVEKDHLRAEAWGGRSNSICRGEIIREEVTGR